MPTIADRTWQCLIKYALEPAHEATFSNRTCGHCGLHLMPGEKVHLHHIDGNHSNWKRTNLLAVHESCHKNIHMGTRDKKEKVTEKAVNNSHVTNRRMNDSLCQSQKRRLSLLIPRSRVRWKSHARIWMGGAVGNTTHRPYQIFLGHQYSVPFLLLSTRHKTRLARGMSVFLG